MQINSQIHLYGIISSTRKRIYIKRVRAGMREAKKEELNFGNPKLAELNKTRAREAKIFAYEHAELVKN